MLLAAGHAGAVPVSEPLPVFSVVAQESYVPIAVSEGGDVFLANAVFADREFRLFVTNAHVLGSSPEGVFLQLGGQWVPARFRSDVVDTENDLAVVQADVLPAGYQAPALPFSRVLPEMGDILLVTGGQLEAALERRPSGYVLIPHSWPYVVALPRALTCLNAPSCGDVFGSYLRAFLKVPMSTGERHKLGHDYMVVLGVSRQHGRMLRQGLSGSPAIDRDGAVAGVVSAIVEGRGDVAIFSSGLIAAELVDRARIVFGTGR